MSRILKGKIVCNCIKQKIREDVKSLMNEGIQVTLGVIRIGKNKGDISYEKSIIKNCKSVGIQVKAFHESDNISTDDLVCLLNKLNEDKTIHGILIFRPLPKQIDESIINKSINPLKDVDCMNPCNLEKIFEGNINGFAPCTPKAAMKIIDYYDIPLDGANVVIVNRSMVVGKPLSMMMLSKNATVTICHSKTKNLKEITQKADIVVTALGKPKYFTEDYFTQQSSIIDVGISYDEKFNICGDIDYDNVSLKVKDITPVPGGVGGVTTSILLSHVVLACKSMK